MTPIQISFPLLAKILALVRLISEKELTLTHALLQFTVIKTLSGASFLGYNSQTTQELANGKNKEARVS
jgi:hypothetical protein